MKWGLTQGMIGGTRASLSPSLTGVGPNTYLTRNDFFKMMGVALLVHGTVFGVASLFPHEKVTNIPVRALSFKLGDQDRIAAYGTETGVGAPTAAPVMSASSAERVSAYVPPVAQPLPKPLPTPPKPVKAAKVVPTPVERPASYSPPVSAPAIAPQPQQYVREVGQAAQQPLAPLPAATPGAYGTSSGAIGGAGTKTTQSEQARHEIQLRYTQQLSGWVDRHKFYPSDGEGRSARVYIRLRIDRTGAVRYYAIEKSSGIPVFDAAAIEMIRLANPFPAVPDNYSDESLFEFVIPISFAPPK